MILKVNDETNITNEVAPKLKYVKKKQYISLVILQIEKENTMAFNHLFPYI